MFINSLSIGIQFHTGCTLSTLGLCVLYESHDNWLRSCTTFQLTEWSLALYYGRPQTPSFFFLFFFFNPFLLWEFMHCRRCRVAIQMYILFNFRWGWSWFICYLPIQVLCAIFSFFLFFTRFVFLNYEFFLWSLSQWWNIQANIESSSEHTLALHCLEMMAGLARGEEICNTFWKILRPMNVYFLGRKLEIERM